jgi:hypothetical protein
MFHAFLDNIRYTTLELNGSIQYVIRDTVYYDMNSAQYVY